MARPSRPSTLDPRPCFWMIVLCSLASVACAGEQVVWQIGTPDKSYDEFAVARNWPAYTAKFGAKPPVFVVGQSEPKSDWPFIHPGPTDSWGDHRVHPFRIRFALAEEPKGVYTLRILLADTHSQAPPTYAVTVGGRTGVFRLPQGGGDASLADPKAGKPYTIQLVLPPGLLRKGDNEIVLACTEGSWVQYDAILLLNDPTGQMPAPDIQSLEVKPTPFFIRKDGKVRRAVDVAVTPTSPVGELTIVAEAGGERIEVPAQPLPMFGGVSQEIGVPESDQPVQVKVTATLAGKSKTATVALAPQRKWRIYVAASSHTDIGYTHVQPECAERHNQNADVAAELCAKFPDFKWNLEVAYQAENYLATRKGEKLDAFLRLAKEGRLGVQALYNNILTGLCSPEEAVRLFYFAKGLERRYGIPFKSAMISDVPTQEAALPMILAGAGIRYFSSGINNTRGFTFTQMYAKSPCWWEGPDGSRVLMVYVPSYAFAERWGLHHSLDHARAVILNELRGLEARKDYPYDAVFLHGAVSDNCPLSPKLAEVAKAWNDRYEFPKVILCHNAEFYEYVERTYGDKLPVVRGSAGTYWEDGAGSSARETALCRNAHEAVGSAEKFLALARRIRPETEYPAEAIYAAWRNCLLYDEHTWGAHCSVSEPESNFTKAQWKIKAQFALDADAQSKALLTQSTRTLASLVKTAGPSFVVINPMSWSRSDVVEVTLPEGQTLDADLTTCDVEGKTLVAVKDVPPCGYRVLRLKAGAGRPVPQPAPGTAIESTFYRVTFDATTGAITSILDKELNRELVDPAAPHKLNQYVYVAGGEGTRIVENGPEAKLTLTSPTEATLRRLRLGSLGERMIIESTATMTPRLVTEVTVWNDAKRVDLANRVTKTLTYKKEAVYFAFPFAATKPTFRYEVPCGIVNANTEMLPGACLDWFTVQHFVEVESADAAIAWATPDAPLVCFQDINRGKWQTALPMTTGHLYAYVMNNYWFTNYLAGQRGEFLFRFAITSRPKADAVASAQFGWAASNPLVAVAADANPQAPLAAETASLVTIAEPNVLLIGAKRAEAGDALILRLWECTGQPTTAHLQLPALAPKKATATNLVEEPGQPLEVRDGTLAVPLRARGLATVAVE